MKKILIFLLLLIVLLTSCSTGNTHETGSAIDNEASKNTTDINSTPIADEEAYEIFSTLDKKALVVVSWYLAENSDDLGIAAESTHAPYYKVSKFSTIDEMKAATDEVFTTGLINQYFYDHAFVDPSGNDTPMYKEIDGELYRNIDQGGIGWPWQSTDEFYVPYQDDRMIVIAIKILLPGDEIEWKYFLLRKDNGVWKLDTYYEMNPYMEYINDYPKKRIELISNAVSSWFCAQDWTDANQLNPNSLINFYLYTYLSDIKEEYDYEKGYQVTSKDVIDGLSAYLKDVKLETLITVNESQGANARYDKDTDSFYFDITFDRADYIVINSETKQNKTTLEIMIIGKSGKAAYMSFLDMEINELEIKLVGNKLVEEFPEE